MRSAFRRGAFSCVVILALWVAPAHATQTRYVNPNSSGGDGTTTATSGANAAYASLSAAVAGLPATLTEPWIIECATGGTADTTAVSIGSITTDTTNTLTITVNAGSRHAGVYDTSKYRLEVSNNFVYALNVAISNVIVQGLQIKQTGGTDALGGINAGGGLSTTNILIDSVIVADTGDTSAEGIKAYSTGTVTIRNSIVYGATHECILSDFATTTVQNSTLVGCGTYGLRKTANGTLTATNVYAGGNTTADFNGTITMTTCASSDSTGTAGLRTIAVATGSGAFFTNVTGGSQDFHIGSSSALKDVGTSLAGSFTTDVDGATRTGTWDIGADENTGGGAPAAIPRLLLLGVGGQR